MDATRICRIFGTLSAGIFAGAAFSPNSGHFQSLCDPSLSPISLVGQFQIWHPRFTLLQSLSTLSTIGATLGHTLYQVIKGRSINYNFLASGSIMLALIPLSAIVFRPMNEVFLTIRDSEAKEHQPELLRILETWMKAQWIRIGAGLAAFTILVVSPFDAF